MTLILATTDKLYSDRKISDEGGTRCDPIRKNALNEVIAAGFAGDFATILEAQTLVESGETDLKTIAKTGVEAIVLKQGRIYVLDTKKVWLRPKRNAYYGVGTGSTEALAYLAGRVRPGKKVTESDIKAAFLYVSRTRVDCGSKYDVISCP